jgi:hypothetical protein
MVSTESEPTNSLYFTFAIVSPYVADGDEDGVFDTDEDGEGLLEGVFDVDPEAVLDGEAEVLVLGVFDTDEEGECD